MLALIRCAAAGLAVLVSIILIVHPSSHSVVAMGLDEEASAVKDLPGYKSAATLIQQQQYEEAIAALNALAKHEDADVLNLLGYSHRKLGKVDEGVAFYLKALAVNPEHRGALEYLGEAYLMKDDLKSAEEIYLKLKDACGYFGCDEASDLSEAIDAYKKKQGS